MSGHHLCLLNGSVVDMNARNVDGVLKHTLLRLKADPNVSKLIKIRLGVHVEPLDRDGKS